MFAACLVDYLRGQPCERAVLLDVAVFTDKLRFLAEAPFRNSNFFKQIIDSNGYANIRITFPQLINVVPFVHIINHVQERQQPLLFTFAH